MAKIDVFNDITFTNTGETPITKTYNLPYTTKCTAIINAVSNGDGYARNFNVYSDGVQKLHTVVSHSINEQVNLGVLDAGIHTLGITISTWVGYWVASASVEADLADFPIIVPETVGDASIVQVTPPADISGPMTISPPVSQAPETTVAEDKSIWSYLTSQPLARILQKSMQEI
jgi:hypothetical protein